MSSLEKLIKNKNVWFKDPSDCLYLTKFNSSNLNVFYINQKWYVLTDDRYYHAAKREIKNMEVLNAATWPFRTKIIPEIVENGNKLYIDESNFNVQEYKSFTKAYPDLVLEHMDLSNIRTIKSNEEIMLIKKACKITDSIFTKFVKYVKPGITEKKLEKVLMKLIFNSHADNISFWPIIAAGRNSANPHWESSEYELRETDMVTVDFGIKYKNYVSDMTRTFAVQEKVTPEEEKIHAAVLRVADLAIKHAKPGVPIAELDKLVKESLKEDGYDKYFTHALGHGIGVDIHENPLIVSSSKEILQRNMVITIEPGVYIPNKYGCRIEQDLVIKKDGAEELNKSEKSLYISK